MLVSFIVPAHNEEAVLGPTLTALRRAAAGAGVDAELIVVDDASTDATTQVAREAGARVVPVAFRQIGRTRNAGAREAGGEVLIFVDADTEVPPETLAATLTALRTGAVGGGAFVRFDEPAPPFLRAMEILLRVSMRMLRLAAGSYLFCTRQAFEAAGGFDERLYATEEIALSRALKRVGRVAIVAPPVLTSGRKARTHSLREWLLPLLAFARRGPGALRTREGLGLWYGGRRRDPGAPAERPRSGP